ncbi:solute carrier family 22 member 6-like [Pararge aegeria]|uniref:solute carrier family 22 member 6-like n=1 Tax=Pararge aegeria TaxID=116150 RepID=UPI0019CFB89E|nr:solute carrier family 22 member 6-like [Pararge aegeria]
MDKECVGWGRWQARIAALLALPVLLTGMYGTNYVFLAAHTPHRCHIPECEDNSTLSGPVDADSWAPGWSSWALPEDSPECHRRPSPGGVCHEDAFDNTTRLDCEDFVYQHHSGIVAEFGLACQEWKRTLVGTVHNAGMLVSLPIMGYVSDKWGRRAALVSSGAGAGVLGLCKSFAGSYPAYLVFEFLETVLGASVYPAAFVLMIEWLGVEHRILASLLLGVPLAAGAASLALLDYLAGYWRTWARLAYPPSLLLLLYPWLLPESVRWLVAGGRAAEAIRVIKQAARANRVAVDAAALDKMLAKDQITNKVEAIVEEESLFSAFIKYGALRRRLLVCFAWWAGAVFVFYGLAVRAHALAGSAHANYALLAAAELPALLLNTLLLDRVGRRPLLTAAWLLTATALIAIPCLPDPSSGAGTALFLAGKMGATMALNALYVYTAELFPTRARQRLLAACSTCGRLGAILAPQTPLLAVYGAWVPTTLLGALPLISAALTRLVPDTLGRHLPDSFADLDNSAATTDTDIP